MLDVLWVEEGEALKLCLVEVHHKYFVGRSQVCLFRRKLPVKVTYIFPVFLEKIKKGYQKFQIGCLGASKHV